MYKVFINNKLVVLTNQRILEALSTNQIYLVYNDFEEIHYVINMLESSEQMDGAVFFHEDLELLWADFRTHYTEIDAGGGLVRNRSGEILMIFRMGKWDLPKGKIEKGESILEGSLREVEEECGVADLEAGDQLITTYHTYEQDESRILKRTTWYEMQSNQTELVPQHEEGIEKVQWMQLTEDVIENLNTYPNIRLVLKSIIAPL